MEDTRMILDLFETQEQWNAYVELANMKQAFTDELKERLSTAMQKLTDRELAGSGWRFACDSLYYLLHCWHASRATNQDNFIDVRV